MAMTLGVVVASNTAAFAGIGVTTWTPSDNGPCAGPYGAGYTNFNDDTEIVKAYDWCADSRSVVGQYRVGTNANPTYSVKVSTGQGTSASVGNGIAEGTNVWIRTCISNNGGAPYGCSGWIKGVA